MRAEAVRRSIEREYRNVGYVEIVAERIGRVLSSPVRRRAALVHDTQRLAEDLTVRLRREING